MLAAGGDDGAILIWDLRQPDKPGFSFQQKAPAGMRTPITSLNFDNLGTIIASASNAVVEGRGLTKGIVSVWDVATGRPVGDSIQVEEGVGALAFGHIDAPDDFIIDAEAALLKVDAEASSTLGRRAVALDATVTAEIRRVMSLWEEALDRFGAEGGFLYGAFSAADAMYAPLVLRFHAYAVEAPPRVANYMARVLAMPAVVEWTTAAMMDPARNATVDAAE